MRHRKSGRALGRNSSHRKAMFRNMATSLLLHGRIRTTDAKAKELRRVVDRLITLSKRVTPSAIEAASGDEQARLRAARLHAVRQARRWVRDRDVLQTLFSDYSERYQERPGGYTRITKIGNRNGDNAALSLIELVDHEFQAVEPPSVGTDEDPAENDARDEDEAATEE